MKQKLLLLSAILFTLALSGPALSRAQSSPANVSASRVEDLSKLNGNEPPMLGIHWERGFNPNFQQRTQKPSRSSSPDMTWHGGIVLPQAVTASIFWGTSWGNSSFVGDKISGLDSWYDGFDGSLYAATSDEYSGSDGQVTSTTSYLGHVIDPSTASGGNRTSAILAEVCKMYPKPTTNGYYAVYVDLKRSGSYCAYHSWGKCNGTPIEFAFFWNLDGDAGCNPQSTVANESQGLAALANVSGHELSEARTDPTGAGWYDSSGSENGDKCVWTFEEPYVTLSNNTNWKMQGEWSNAAYNGRYGYPNSSGQDGCLQGDNDGDQD
jgi:hypothetical protein